MRKIPACGNIVSWLFTPPLYLLLSTLAHIGFCLLSSRLLVGSFLFPLSIGIGLVGLPPMRRLR